MFANMMDWRIGIISTRGFINAFASAIVVACLSTVALGQPADPAARPDRGTRPVGSYSISDIESISLQNGNVDISIPLASLPPIAGGNLSFTVTAHHNSKNWDMSSYENESDLFHNNFWTAQQIDQSTTGGWRIGGGYGIRLHLAESDFVPVDPGCTGGLACQEKLYRYKMFLVTPDGSQHELRPRDYLQGATQNYRIGFYKDTPETTGVQMRYYSFDGSYLFARIDPYSVVPTNWEVYLPDGTRISNNGGIQKIRDTNGNQIRILTETDVQTGVVTTTYTDLGTVNNGNGPREIKVIAPSNQPPTQVTYQTVGVGSTATVETIDIAWGTTHVEQLYNVDDHTCPDVMALIFEDLAVVRSITLPRTEPTPLPRKQFTFSYNSDSAPDTMNLQWRGACGSPTITQNTVSHGWGSISEMDTPDGAQVKYSYLLDGNSSFARGPKGAIEAAGETITQKQVVHDGVTDSWTYTIPRGLGATTASVLGPDGLLTSINYYPHDPAFAGSFGGSDGKGGLLYRTTESNKRIVERHWAFKLFNGGDATNPNGLVSFNPVVDNEYTTLMDSNGSPSKMCAKSMVYDFNGNVTSETDYDWIDLGQTPVNRDAQDVPTGFPGTTVLRTITNTYYNAANGAGAINYAKRDLSTVTPLIVNAMQETISGSADVRYSYDNQAYGSAPTFGNLTRVSRLKSGTTFLDTTFTYDVYGNKLTATDPKGNKTDFTYDANTHAQPTEIKVYADKLNTSVFNRTMIAYDYWTGVVTSQTDPNGNVITTSYDNQMMSVPGNAVKDPFGRPGLAIDPLGRKVKTFYHDSSLQVEARADLKTVDDGLLKTMMTRDRLGQTVKSEDGSTYTVATDSAYEQMGKITYTSNPHRVGTASTDGWTRITKDEMGRVLEIATFDGATKPSASATNWNGHVQTSYNAEQTTVTDQASKQRKSVVDGLGRLRKVFEDPGSSNFETDYTYDALGNLLQVDQGSQHRLFTYDSLSRLKTATNPEQLNVPTNYDYDDASNLMTRANPNGTTVGFTYDGLNRVKTKTLSSGGTWDYTYDSTTILNAKGRLVSVVLHGATDGYYYDGYDAMGRVTASHQITSSGAAAGYAMSYGYDLAGNMTSETYPSGRQVITEYDSAGRAAGIRSAAIYYAGAKASDATNRIQYAAHGAVSVMKFDNDLWEHTLFNARLQPTEIGLGATSSASDLLKLQYTYNTTGQANNNGNVQTQSITAPKTSGGNLVLTQTYTYDALNRLQSASENGSPTWAQTYDYDRWGNRAVRSTSYIPQPLLTPQSFFAGDMSAFSSSTNRIALSGFGYDTSGNVTGDPTTSANAILYDSENRQTSYTKSGVTTSYSYDGDGRRVKKVDNSGTIIFVYNAGGEMIAEYTSGNPSNGGTSYLTSDHLGSTRVVTKSDGNVKARYDYLPFGEEIGSDKGNRSSVTGYVTSDSTRQKFTQKERDNESGLDYFGARYYSGAQGRFTSVDPIGFNGRTLASPQDWNRYAYTINNPLKFIDPDGAERLQVIVQTFIPMRTVAAPGRAFVNNRWFEGDHRKAGEPGGFRTQQIIPIETDPTKNGGNPQLGRMNRDTGITRELSSPNGEEIGKGRASGETLGGEVTRDESGVVNIHVHGNESDPLITGAPGISYNFDIKVQSDGPQGNATITVSGEHDKFPAYEIIVSRPELPKTGSSVVYQHDPRDANSTPFSLFPIAPHIQIKPPKTTIIRPDGSVE